ncbi:Phosphoglycerate dehydrogenase [Salinibacillus kushneri]|uniref:Phosphoglycerate dehydrogenase n=1 Tax=Salinibacillus kushneri TaxID=237682 RepID=A0A1I0GI68_9BACI|nr:D-2-hydroxyacid dehydrogenase [Salinibacillus kushneri]SET70639.1 Phosphoglycerate dehydrogenase [Salinibacillus kushneri]
MEILTTCRIKRSIQDRLLHSYPSLTFRFCDDIKEAEAYLPQAEVLITYGEDLTDNHIDKAENLKWIMVISAGVDKMPFGTIREKSILVTNVRGIHGIPMSEYAISMLLQVSRQAKILYNNEQKHHWDRTVYMTEMYGQTMLVVGTGAIGQEVARLAKAFQMKTIGLSRSGRPAKYFDDTGQIDQLLEKLPEADYIVSVLPSTDDTKHIYQESHFQAMKDQAIFLNMGRGDAVDEKALIKALNQNEIRHAVLDVFEQEPLPEDHPFWDMENVTVTPHISGISRYYQPRAFEIFEANLEKYLNNQTDFINIIDPERGY